MANLVLFFIAKKNEKEDVRSEMMLALWEAIAKMDYCENEKACFAFLGNALKNRFWELHRKSRKVHDSQISLLYVLTI